MASHLPFMLDASVGDYGKLIAHFAKANHHWKAINEATEILVVFQGAHSYISPRWYETPGVVPTWNYGTVHAYGKAKIVHEHAALKAMVKDLVNLHDNLADLETAFPDNLLDAIVGIEIVIERLEGKFKFSQNKSVADQQGVIAALSQSEHEIEREVAEIMQANLEKRSEG
jgi:transcriptional regulator